MWPTSSDARCAIRLWQSLLTVGQLASDAGQHRLHGGGADLQQRVVRLRMLEELSGDDVARELGLRADHVATLLYRAKKELFRCVTGPAN